MHLLGPTVLGIVMLLLLGGLLVVKQVATGSVLDRPQGTFLVQFGNVFNLFFLLVVNLLTAIGLLLGRIESLDPAHVQIQPGWLLTSLEIVGWLLYVAGFALMGWALLTLGRNYQLGGSAPRSEDHMVIDGPYAFIRHPMYSAALSIALGLACLAQSLAFLSVFVIYVVLMFGLVPVEERELEKAYGDQYAKYKRTTKILIPAIY